VRLGSLQRHVLRRLAEGAFGALALVYIVTTLVGWVEELENAETGVSFLARAHATSWETLTSVVGLCVAIGAGFALSNFARERGGVATALGGAALARVVLPGALALSALVGLWRWMGPTHEQVRGAVHWGESEWGWITEESDSSLDWLWVRHDGFETSLSAGSAGGREDAPPEQAVASLSEERVGLPAWSRDSLVLLLVLLTLAARLDRRPDGALLEAVPIALFGHWGPLALTPLIRVLTQTSAVGADIITLSLIGAGLWVASRVPLR